MNIIVAMDKNNLIGKDNTLPWSYPEDMKYFKKITMDAVIIMGRKTYESIGRELPGRVNIILSKTLENEKLNIARNIAEATSMAEKYHKTIFIIGGSNIYQQMLPHTTNLYITRINKEYEGDSFFPKIRDDLWYLSSSIKGEDKDLTFEIYTKKAQGIPKKVFF